MAPKKTPVYGWINVYESGYYHRAGKPGAFDRHAGDIYADKDVAMREVDPVELYIDTVPVFWTEQHSIEANPS